MVHREDREETGLSAEENELVYLRRRVRELEARGLGLAYFRAVNVERAKAFPSAKQNWSPADWMVALMGEVGELAAVLPDRPMPDGSADPAEMAKRVIAGLGAVTNTMKKLRRGTDYTKGKSQGELRAELSRQFTAFVWWSRRLGEMLFEGAIPDVADVGVLEADKDPAGEIGDVQTYLDLLAHSVGVELGPATVSKFNEVSKRVGSPLVLE